MNTVEAGRSAESMAAKYLEAKGFEIIKRNYQIRGGEIDIIAMDGSFLVFIEVKMRSSEQFGRGAEAVTKKKKDFLVRTAERYIYENDKYGMNMRFDVVEITNREGKHFVRHIKNAFERN